MRLLWKSLWLVALMGVVTGLQACGRSTSVPAETPEALVAKWKQVAEAGLQEAHKQADIYTAMDVAQKLSKNGPSGLDPLIDILADPASDPRTKMLVTISIKPVLAQENLPRIEELTDAKYDVNTRVNAAHLTGSFQDEALMKRAEELLQDPEPRVRLAVFQTQLLRGVPAALAMVDTIWKDPATPVSDLGQLVNGLPEKDAPQHLAMFEAAVVNAQLDPQARARAIQVLGQYGGASALSALDKSATTDPDPDLKKAAQVAWEALKSRLDSTGAAPAPAAGAEAPAPATEPAAAPAAMSPEEISKFTGGKAPKMIEVPAPTGQRPAEAPPAASK